MPLAHLCCMQEKAFPTGLSFTLVLWRMFLAWRLTFLRSATINLGSEDSLLWLFVWLSKQCGITGADPQSRAVCAKDLMSTLCTFGGVYFGWALVKPSNGWSSSSNFMYKKPSPLAPRPHGGVNCSLVSVMIRKITWEGHSLFIQAKKPV